MLGSLLFKLAILPYKTKLIKIWTERNLFTFNIDISFQDTSMYMYLQDVIDRKNIITKKTIHTLYTSSSAEVKTTFPLDLNS